MKKSLFLFSILAFALSVLPAAAAKPNYAPELPETDGTYDVPGHPDMKLRIFVHRAKPAKPAPNPSVKQCGLADPESLSVTGPAGWRMDGAWTYRVNSAVPASLLAYDINSIVSNSFSAWGAVPGVTVAPGLPTTINRAVKDGQNIVAWGRTSGSALGVTYIWYQDGLATELDTVMNQKFAWNWGGGGTQCAYTDVYDAQNILTHELGHWFGLDDHYTGDYADNTMYGYGAKWETKKNTPTQGDLAGLADIYSY